MRKELIKFLLENRLFLNETGEQLLEELIETINKNIEKAALPVLGMLGRDLKGIFIIDGSGEKINREEHPVYFSFLMENYNELSKAKFHLN